jgi:ABC-2 type transport system permease protein
MWIRVFALVQRYVFLYKRSIARAGEVVFWPVMDLLVWGFTTRYLETVSAPGAVRFLMGAVLFWDILYRAQQAITLTLTEEIWSRNIINLFVAPISPFEICVATCLCGVLKAGVNALILWLLAWLLFEFKVLDCGLYLVPFTASLIIYGWAVGMVTSALILRFGQAAEAFVWGVPFLVQPISAVFYPLDVLPEWLRVIALCLPSTYIFEGMRAALRDHTVSLSHLAAAFALNAAYLVLAGFFWAWMLRRVREKGFLGRLGME